VSSSIIKGFSPKIRSIYHFLEFEITRTSIPGSNPSISYNIPELMVNIKRRAPINAGSHPKVKYMPVIKVNPMTPPIGEFVAFRIYKGIAPTNAIPQTINNNTTLLSTSLFTHDMPTGCG